MSAIEIIEKIKSLPRDEKWTLFCFLSDEFGHADEARLSEEFAKIGADTAGADVSFGFPAQADALKHGCRIYD